MSLPLGRNQTMKKILGAVENKFEELKGQLRILRAVIAIAPLTEEESKNLLVIVNEMAYELNRKVMEWKPE